MNLGVVVHGGLITKGLYGRKGSARSRVAKAEGSGLPCGTRVSVTVFRREEDGDGKHRRFLRPFRRPAPLCSPAISRLSLSLVIGAREREKGRKGGTEERIRAESAGDVKRVDREEERERERETNGCAGRERKREKAGTRKREREGARSPRTVGGKGD